MYSAHKLSKQSDNTQLCHTTFPILNQSIVPSPVLTVASWPTYRLLRRQERWSGTLISLRIFHSKLWSTQSKVLTQSMKKKLVFFWNSFAFSMIQQMLDIWSLVPLPFQNPTCCIAKWTKFLVHILLKPSLKDFEHNLASMWNEHNCMIVWTFFSIYLIWNWNENWPFPVLWPLLCFPICWHIECSTLTGSTLGILNSSAGTPSPSLALFLVTLPKAHLTSHSRMSSSRWMTTPLWFSCLLRLILRSSVCSCSLFLISSVSVGSYHLCPLSCASLHTMFPWNLQFSWRDL